MTAPRTPSEDDPGSAWPFADAATLAPAAADHPDPAIREGFRRAWDGASVAERVEAMSEWFRRAALSGSRAGTDRLEALCGELANSTEPADPPGIAEVERTERAARSLAVRLSREGTLGRSRPAAARLALRLGADPFRISGDGGLAHIPGGPERLACALALEAHFGPAPDEVLAEAISTTLLGGSREAAEACMRTVRERFGGILPRRVLSSHGAERGCARLCAAAEDSARDGTESAFGLCLDILRCAAESRRILGERLDRRRIDPALRRRRLFLACLEAALFADASSELAGRPAPETRSDRL